MRLGTPGFVGERLVQAREARGLSAVTLAELIRVSPQSVSHYEQGKHSPSPEVMALLASALKFPRSFFLRPAPRPDGAAVFWRSNIGALKSARRRAEAKLVWFDEIMGFLAQFFDFPPVKLPDIDVKDFRILDDEDIESAARRCREKWQLGCGPIPNVCRAMEERGIIVGRMRVDAAGLDAFSHWPAASLHPRVMLSTDKLNAARSRFDAAHELGHIVLHRGIDRKKINSPADFKLLENQAHRFASAFLLPSEMFARELWLPSIDSMLNLKERWGCSIAAMIMRSGHIGLLEGEDLRRAWINYTRRGWRAGEPLDDRVQEERPSLLRKSFEMLVKEGGQPPRQILLQLHLDADDVEELAGLPNGFFQTGEDVAEFGPRLKQKTPEIASDFPSADGGQIIDLARARGR